MKMLEDFFAAWVMEISEYCEAWKEVKEQLPRDSQPNLPLSGPDSMIPALQVRG